MRPFPDVSSGLGWQVSTSISPDGQRFLMIKPLADADRAAATTSIVVVQNWFEELKRLVPATR